MLIESNNDEEDSDSCSFSKLNASLKDTLRIVLQNVTLEDYIKSLGKEIRALNYNSVSLEQLRTNHKTNLELMITCVKEVRGPLTTYRRVGLILRNLSPLLKE